ncbi:hypothetical protein A4A49_05386 [Nicotiana attenuata]|uniref:Uncharacterized protein n=1 Tax=Nicotiana attenuata TaxID=49451 RepID=A0A314KWK2_NICAT|nr:hypothetical protein A4A49_05386 [Nicotiana attenuata]
MDLKLENGPIDSDVNFKLKRNNSSKVEQAIASKIKTSNRKPQASNSNRNRNLERTELRNSLSNRGNQISLDITNSILKSAFK